MKKIKVLSVIGTRPAAIKMAPVVQALEKSERHESIVCLTGQHRQMLDQMVSLFDLRVDYDLNIMKKGQTLSHIVSQVTEKLQNVIQRTQPDWLLIQGDTATCFAAALTGFYNKIKLGHVEAGLRTYNLQAPFPEEANRQLVSRIANMHFAPTETSKANLEKEGVKPEKIIVTGNTVIDALLWMKERVSWKAEWQQDLASATTVLTSGKPYVLVTGHRRENHGSGFINICEALRTLAEKYSQWHFIYPVHLNPNVQTPVYKILSGIDNIHLIEPLNYDLLVYLLENCSIVLTDSGGIQEEAPSLGKPVLVMRETTERPEGITAGTAKLLGTNVDDIVNNVSLLIDDSAEYQKMARAVNPYGDGQASDRIIRVLS